MEMVHHPPLCKRCCRFQLERQLGIPQASFREHDDVPVIIAEADALGHEVISEDWLIDNLPEDWTYDCMMEPYFAFTIYRGASLMSTIPLILLRQSG